MVAEPIMPVVHHPIAFVVHLEVASGCARRPTSTDAAHFDVSRHGRYGSLQCTGKQGPSVDMLNLTFHVTMASDVSCGPSACTSSTVHREPPVERNDTAMSV